MLFKKEEKKKLIEFIFFSFLFKIMGYIDRDCLCMSESDVDFPDQDISTVD